MLLAACGQEYEDFRIAQAEWPSFKPNYIFTQVIEVKKCIFSRKKCNSIRIF